MEFQETEHQKQPEPIRRIVSFHKNEHVTNRDQCEKIYYAIWLLCQVIIIFIILAQFFDSAQLITYVFGNNDNCEKFRKNS